MKSQQLSETPTRTDQKKLIEKLNASNSGFSLMHMDQSTAFPGANYELSACLADMDDIEYALYQRDGLYFVLVDIFHDLSEANEQAREIINQNPKLRASINGYAETVTKGKL